MDGRTLREDLLGILIEMLCAKTRLRKEEY